MQQEYDGPLGSMKQLHGSEKADTWPTSMAAVHFASDQNGKQAYSRYRNDRQALQSRTGTTNRISEADAKLIGDGVMRTMQIRPFPGQWIKFSDLDALFRERLVGERVIWPDQATTLVAYMAWPNDATARRLWLSAHQPIDHSAIERLVGGLKLFSNIGLGSLILSICITILRRVSTRKLAADRALAKAFF
jgi:hypothetical protein